MYEKLQRWYSYTIFLLQDLARAMSRDELFKWKARVVISGLECFLVLTLILAISILGGWPPFMGSETIFLGCGLVLYSVFYWMNGEAEPHLLPRFEREFRRLDKTTRAVATGCLIMFLALTIAALLGLGHIAQKHPVTSSPASSATNAAGRGE